MVRWRYNGSCGRYCELPTIPERILVNFLLYLFIRGELSSILDMTKSRMFHVHDSYCFILGKFLDEKHLKTSIQEWVKEKLKFNKGMCTITGI